MSEFRVLGAMCVVLEDKLDEKTNSGIVLTQRKKQNANRGTIISVGQGSRADDGTLIPMQVKVGDRVIYKSYSGIPIVVDAKNRNNDNQLLILNERDVLAVLIDEK